MVVLLAIAIAGREGETAARQGRTEGSEVELVAFLEGHDHGTAIAIAIAVVADDVFVFVVAAVVVAASGDIFSYLERSRGGREMDHDGLVGFGLGDTR